MSLAAVHMPADVYYACTLHALSVEEEEVMGLLIGKFEDGDAYITSQIILQRSDKRKDRVEISTEQLHSAMLKTSELSEAMGEPINVLGWYHSHPHITVQPSHVDLRTQASYQMMDDRFVGIIFSVFNVDKTKGQEIQITCFQATRQGREGPFEKVEVPLFVESVKKLSAPCSESIFRLPEIISQEDLTNYNEISKSCQSNYLTKLQNDSAFVMSQSHILNATVNPLLLNAELRQSSSIQFIKELTKEKERLEKLLKDLVEIFGEAVLGLSQGSVSELLSKPKPWHMLSIKGREPFIRMQLWLSDAHNIDRLQALKNERRELNKRRRSSGHGGDNSSDTSSNDTSEFYHSASPGPGPPSAKKQRVLFNEEQKEALRLAFALDSYPNVATIEFLANELGLSPRTITNWFHNHRMRLKQQVPHPQESNPNVQRDPQQPFDPVQFRVLLNQRLLEVQKERLGLGSVPLPYPPYFANNNLASLISRGLISPECENLLANVAKEQFGGLDLSMSGLKREPYDDEDIGSELGSEDSNLSSASLRDVKKEEGEDVEEERTTASAGQNRSSRRKPAAPQWVNPEWQEEKKNMENEVIINGVCVMQTDEFSREKEEETVRVEPTAVLDRYEHSDESSDEQNNERESETTAETAEKEQEKTKDSKTSKEGNNWEF